MLFSKNVTHAVWIIMMLEPLNKQLIKHSGRGGKISAEGLSAVNISRQCGYKGACNMEVTRILDVLMEHQVLRTVYPEKSTVILYALNVSPEKLTIYDLVTIFDYGIRFGEPDLYRETTENYKAEPKMEKFVALSNLIKEEMHRKLENMRLSDVISEINARTLMNEK